MGFGSGLWTAETPHTSAASAVLIRYCCGGDGSLRQITAASTMRRLCILGFATLLLSPLFGPVAHAEPRSTEPRGASAPRIEWEVKNRFRLFRNEADFQRHVAATRNDGVLAAEQRLARASDGRGWARDTVERLCVDRSGKLLEFCDRDGEREVYLSPRDHRVGVMLAGNLPANEGCVWSFDDGEGAARQFTGACNEEVKIRLRHGRQTFASVDIVLPDGTAQRLVSEIQVRDVLIAGMGDSIAAGEGNPDRAVRLSDEGFCFQRFDGGEYYRPGRAGFSGNKSCNITFGDDAGVSDWARQSARWMSGACHRSLYSYQMRTALGARGRESAYRRHLHSARLLRRHHQRRLPRQPARERMPQSRHRCVLSRNLARAGRGADRPRSRPRASTAPTAASIWFCSPSAPTTSCSPA